MTSSIWISGLRSFLFWQASREMIRTGRPEKALVGMKIHQVSLVALVIVGMAALSAQARSQPQPYLEDSSDGSVGTATVESPDMVYIPPTKATKLKTYAFDGYSQRFGSDFGIAAAGTTTRYLLAGALKQDTLYYRCGCGGLFPRLRHAVVSTLTGRSGRDGHRVFSIPALVAPYAGSLTAVYGWYPSRFEAKDAFRMGNYSLLESIGSNIGLEFFYSGPHSLLSRMHLNNSHGAPTQGPKP